jgi:hypothetical protein
MSSGDGTGSTIDILTNNADIIIGASDTNITLDVSTGQIVLTPGVSGSDEAVVPGVNNTFSLGTTSLQWSDLFLGEGGVINWDNGDATLTQAGNVVTLAGAQLSLAEGQIVFPATQNASANANTLDDYEEGTWTPTFTFDTPGDLSRTFDAQLGAYTKIGRVVLLQLDLSTSAFTHTTASGSLNITGAPFTTVASPAITPRGALAWQGITKANYTDLYLAAANSLGATLLVQASGSGQAVVVIAAADMPTGGSVVLRGTISIQV